MRLIVLGASGNTGQVVVRQALAAGHEVTAFLRDPERLPLRDPRLSIARGDARSLEDLRSALVGQDAVISALGGGSTTAPVGSSRGQPGEGVMERSTGALIRAASEGGVRRVVMLSTFMLAPNFRAGILKPLARLNKAMNDDKRAGERALMESALDWTIVYATRLTDGERTGRERVVPETETVTPRNTVSRSDVAAFLLAELTDEASIRRSLVVTTA